jgi:hypothetical protein
VFIYFICLIKFLGVESIGSLRNYFSGRYKGISLQPAIGPTHLARAAPNLCDFPTPMGIFSLFDREELKTVAFPPTEQWQGSTTQATAINPGQALSSLK